MTITEILEQAKLLSAEERRELATLLFNLPDNIDQHPKHLSDLRGVGKDLWVGIDAQDYVNRIRDEWD